MRRGAARCPSSVHRPAAQVVAAVDAAETDRQTDRQTALMAEAPPRKKKRNLAAERSQKVIFKNP